MHFLRRHWLLIGILVFGAILRMTNLNWDAGGRLHPDEALIVNGALSIKFFSNLFPGFHDYNGFSVYLLKLASLSVSFVTHNPWWSQTPEGVTVAGRYISASLSTLSIFFIYLLGKRLWNIHAGLLSAALLAAVPLHMQLAHFYTTESILVCFFLVLLYGTALYSHAPNMHSLVRMSVAAGLLIATKNTAYLFLPIPLMCILIKGKELGRTVQAMAIFFGIGVTAFFFASPYSFIDFRGYAERSSYLQDVVSGRLLMDWTIQFLDTTGWFWLPNIFMSFGPIFIAGCIGICGFLLHKKNSTWKTEAIFAIWGVGFYIFLSLTYLKFVRYSAPLIPLVALFGAKFLFDIHRTRVGKILLYGFVGMQLSMGLMYFSMYTTPHTSLSATQWIRRNIPPHTAILTEEWNGVIRFNQPELADKNYFLQSFNFYSLPDDDAKMKDVWTRTAVSAYIILESPKVKNTITRLAHKYPKSSQWYADLEAGTLGFQKIAVFSSYPRLGPFALPDDHLEETFTVFDHPTITIYKKVSSN